MVWELLVGAQCSKPGRASGLGQSKSLQGDFPLKWHQVAFFLLGDHSHKSAALSGNSSQWSPRQVLGFFPSPGLGWRGFCSSFALLVAAIRASLQNIYQFIRLLLECAHSHPQDWELLSKSISFSFPLRLCTFACRTCTALLKSQIKSILESFRLENTFNSPSPSCPMRVTQRWIFHVTCPAQGLPNGAFESLTTWWIFIP